MDWLRNLVQATPELTLFICLALGYLVGKLRIGPIQLGGICGTLARPRCATSSTPC